MRAVVIGGDHQWQRYTVVGCAGESTAAAVAAAAVAAMSASQAPGVTDTRDGRQATGSTPRSDDPDTATGNSPYYTDLPPLNTNSPTKPGEDGPTGTGEAEAGIPATVLDAYKKAESALAEAKPGCQPALGAPRGDRQGRVGPGPRRPRDANGTTLSLILGPQLNGVGFANITDTDGGAYDGDTTHDRAVGPMQFIP